MKLYNEQISNVLTLLQKENGRKLITEGTPWPEAGKQNLVLRGEMSYELGAGTLPAVSFLGVTSLKELVPADDAFLYGRDLAEIKADAPYARITLLRVEDQLMNRGEEIYDAMRRFINTRYHVNPSGFMNRISTGSKHEPVRISKVALDQGLSFAKVARLYMDAYREHKEVIAVQVIFVTLPDFNYAELTKLAQKNEEITLSLDHILRDVKMDCTTCKLQSICNEVDGMKELHFQTNSTK